jgi:hypothetical protein
VDPLLLEKLSNRLSELRNQGVELPDPASMAIRSVDGFYHFPSLVALAAGSEDNVISVVNYDPVRRTFLLSKDGKPDDIMELFWFGFETFPKDMILLYTSPEGGDELSYPEDMDTRVNLSLGIMREWKDSRSLEHSTGMYWRGETLDSLVLHLREGKRKDPADQRSQ